MVQIVEDQVDNIYEGPLIPNESENIPIVHFTGTSLERVPRDP